MNQFLGDYQIINRFLLPERQKPIESGNIFVGGSKSKVGDRGLCKRTKPIVVIGYDSTIAYLHRHLIEYLYLNKNKIKNDNKR